MPSIERILVVIDPTSDQQPALERAVWLANGSGAALELFICDYDQYLASEQVFDSAPLAQARNTLIAGHLARLRQQAQRLSKQGIPVLVDARWDHPLHEGIARKVRDSMPDVVFKDTHYHAALKRSVFSNTDWNLIRCCPVPLWLVKPHPVSQNPRILAAVDPLHEHDKPAALDHRIIAMAADVAGLINGELHLIHAYEIAPAIAVSVGSMSTPIAVPLRDVADSLKKEHEDAVFALADQHAVKHDRVHVHQGPTRAVLVRLTEQLQADVVVLGAIARSGLRRLFLGSTAEQVLDRLPCDLLVIRAGADTAADRRIEAQRNSRPCAVD